MQKYLDDNPMESLVDLEDSKNESLLSTNPLGKYWNSGRNVYVEFDSRAFLKFMPEQVA